VSIRFPKKNKHNAVSIPNNGNKSVRMNQFLGQKEKGVGGAGGSLVNF
jgi:hypothetical protein